MNLRLDLLRSEYLLDDAVFVNEVSGAKNAYGLSAARHLLSPAAKLLQERSLRISDKRKLQSLRFSKLLLRSLLVLADADDVVSCRSQLVLMWAHPINQGGLSI